VRDITNNKKRSPPSGLLFLLLQAELFEQQYPHKIDPTKDDTAGDRDQNADDQTEQTALLHPGGPSDDDLSYPVDNRDDQQKELNQTALFVKPSHKYDLLK
jgi:hypothetical protein